jgi:hypothetical protein
MATQQKEEQANPYNANKEWHKGDSQDFVSADSAFFEKPQVETKKKETRKSSKKSSEENTDNYKQRYDSLKKHYDSKLNEFKTREQELLEQAAKNVPEYVAPKSPDDLAKFREEYPDVMGVVETVAHMQSSEQMKVLEEKLKALQERETELVTKQAHERLMNNHPDFEDIRESDDFHQWAKSQPQSIQDWIYKNNSDGDLASRALDLYKRDVGIESSARVEKPSSKKSNKSAADMVSTKTTAVEPKQDKIWTEREIAAMSIIEFDKYEEEIGKAIHEGRVVK